MFILKISDFWLQTKIIKSDTTVIWNIVEIYSEILVDTQDY